MTKRPPISPEIIRHGASLRRTVLAAQRDGKVVGFVPTMGALHEGHLSLVRAARRDCDTVIVSVFVNPTQFAPGEDFDSYPRDLEQDCGLLATAGCDWVFAPSPEEMYPDNCRTTIDVGPVTLPFEGRVRPQHFRGVATVVLKLFNLCPADRAYFGRKDYQQTVVVRQMVRDLNLPIEIKVCPLIRDADGLALSSRNARLTDDQRRRALALPKSLELVEQMVSEGQGASVAGLRAAVEKVLAEENLEPDYIAFVQEGTLDPVEKIAGPTAVLVAVPVGEIRLLDNTLVG